MGNSIFTNVDAVASAFPHVRGASVLGVINADRRPSRFRGVVCPLTPAAEVQGIALSTVSPVVGDQLTRGMAFDKYRTGSPAPGLTG